MLSVLGRMFRKANNIDKVLLLFFMLRSCCVHTVQCVSVGWCVTLPYC